MHITCGISVLEAGSRRRGPAAWLMLIYDQSTVGCHDTLSRLWWGRKEAVGLHQLVHHLPSPVMLLLSHTFPWRVTPHMMPYSDG
jgi:hypothetical protein